MGIGVLVADFALSLHSPEYEEAAPISLQKITLVTVQSSFVGCCIVLVAYLGNEVNESSAHHISLLRRQRYLLFRGGKDVIDPQTNELAAGLIETVCDDLNDEHTARPVTFLGLYCGFSLLSLLYAIPASVGYSLIGYCMESDHCVRHLTES